MSVLSPSSCLKHLSERDMIKMYVGLNVKYLLVLSVLMKFDFSGEFFEKILEYQILWKSDQWEFFRADRRTDRRDEANNGFSQFGERA